MYCLETQAVYHRFHGAPPILHDLHLRMPAHSIYGFLGPNGAGKTTTMRLLAGLSRLQQGSIRIFDLPLGSHRVELLGQMGILIESPSFYSHLDARSNLRLLQRIYGCPKHRIDAVLRLTGLGDTGTKTVGRFSLGMKQRFAIAAALLNEPALLLLDEPTNGLDPNGMAEVRELLLQLNREEGTSILLSSHLLSEIARLATHIGIIHRGRLLFQGTMGELERKGSARMSLAVDDIGRTLFLLRSSQLDAVEQDGRILFDRLDNDSIAGLVRRLVEAGVSIYELAVLEQDLEQIFMQYVRD